MKFDPSSQTSEVSLLKDIVSSDTLNKFTKQKLSEVKNIGFSYKGLKDGIFKSAGLANNSNLKQEETRDLREKRAPYASEGARFVSKGATGQPQRFS